MLGPDVVVQEPIGLFGGKLQYALGFRAERNFNRRGDLLSKHRPAFDLLPDAFEREVGAREDSASQAFTFPNQAQEEVLGLNRNAAELAGLVAGEEKYSPGPFG